MTTKILLPTYLATLPSSGKKVKFRPFTVKEEKSLLLALQESDIEVVTIAIKSIVEVCTSGEVDPENTPYYDIEYLFLQIRAKSIGEIIELVGTCDCGPNKKTEFSVDIADTTVLPKPTGNIKLSIPDTNYIIEFRHPSIDDFSRLFTKSNDNATDVVANCIVSVCTDDEVMNWSPEEKKDFVESMTTKQQRGIAQFLKDMPMVKINTSFKCIHCNKQHTNSMSGFENFFV
jgi:hypothetical protein